MKPMVNKSGFQGKRSVVRIQAWQCIGCGKVEAPQPCLGVCQDRKIELVGAEAYQDVLSELERAQQRIDALRMLLVRLTRAKPRKEGWSASWKQLQQQARMALDDDFRLS